MPYFHGTKIEKLPAIVTNGLDGTNTRPNSEICERGIYLAADPRLCITILMMHYANGASGNIPPTTELASWRVIVIDDARIDETKLRPDPQVSDWEGSYLYAGQIDITNSVILTVDNILSGNVQSIAGAERWRSVDAP